MITKRQPQKGRQRTRGPAGEGEHDDVVVGPRVVLVRREEGQLLHAFLPQIQQHGGVDHGHWEAAQPVAVASGEILCCSPIVPLSVSGQNSRHRNNGMIFILKHIFLSWNPCTHQIHWSKLDVRRLFSSHLCIQLNSNDWLLLHAAFRVHAHLRSDAAPVVGVRPLRIEHGSDDRLVLRYEQVERVWVGEDVVCVSVLKQRDTRGQRRERNRRVTAASCPGNSRCQNFFFFSLLDETTAAKTEQISSDKSRDGGLVWIRRCCHMKDCFIMYQDVIGPAFPGKVERCLLQLHHVLISAVGPMLGTQLSCIGPVTERCNRHISDYYCTVLPKYIL